MTRLLDKLEFIVVPIVNPDGYEVILYVETVAEVLAIMLIQYTWTDDRLWRKNRANIGDSECRGVDLNRNFNDHWNEVNPCAFLQSVT